MKNIEKKFKKNILEKIMDFMEKLILQKFVPKYLSHIRARFCLKKPNKKCQKVKKEGCSHPNIAKKLA